MTIMIKRNKETINAIETKNAFLFIQLHKPDTTAQTRYNCTNQIQLHKPDTTAQNV